MLIRQGDVFLKKINELPKELKQKEDKIIAWGEVTGHKHRFESDNVLVLVDNEGKQYVDVKQESELVHEEHKNLVIPKGLYEVIIQRELDIIEGVRQVVD